MSKLFMMYRKRKIIFYYKNVYVCVGRGEDKNEEEKKEIYKLIENAL